MSKKTTAAKSNPSFFKYFLVSCMLLAFLILLLLQNREAEKFTQISLIEKTLPDRVMGGKPFVFGFQIKNLEGKDMAYGYLAKLDGEIILQNRLTVKRLETKPVFLEAPKTQNGPHVIRIEVNSDEQKQYALFFRFETV
ncbi:hypothetical protein HY989_06760 [Candidatus Micrarchaeota archaeon]|nr:hypothetical protein [Candidatus Micrarchaeota archaeon]